jgi:hypothetical protein
MALHSSGRVREMIMQHHTLGQRKTSATKQLGDLWQHYPERQEICNNSSGCEEWIRLTAIANQISRVPWLVKVFLSLAYINHRTKLNQYSKGNI